jgi:hypothetical protein
METNSGGDIDANSDLTDYGTSIMEPATFFDSALGSRYAKVTAFSFPDSLAASESGSVIPCTDQ